MHKHMVSIGQRIKGDTTGFSPPIHSQTRRKNKTKHMVDLSYHQAKLVKNNKQKRENVKPKKNNAQVRHKRKQSHFQ